LIKPIHIINERTGPYATTVISKIVPDHQQFVIQHIIRERVLNRN
jgi:molybdate-binding protein